ncbi:MAG: glycerate kinase type-2 family protein [Desulfobacterales bacterium]
MRSPFDCRKQLEIIFRAGLERVDPYAMIKTHVRIEDRRLIVDPGEDPIEISLDRYDRIFVIGAGKATASMARAMEEILGERIDQGLIAVKYGHTAPLSRIEMLESGHPVPDENGVQAALRIARLADAADERTLVISLISGGGSAILPSPMVCTVDGRERRLSLNDKQETTRALLACGADIREINCVRKHLSDLKGGRLLQRIAPARALNLILSDVVGDDLSSIASGMTVVDPTTYTDALSILNAYGLADYVPKAVMEILRLGEEGRIPETLKEKELSGDCVDNILIGTNRQALLAAAEQARRMGFNVCVLTSRITGEAREVARYFAGIAMDIRSEDLLIAKPACVLAGGEPTVTLKGSGKGGRNQEMALAFLAQLEAASEPVEGIHFLAASTDGNDGPTDAAGAFADVALLKRSREKGLSIRDSLANNDAYTFFDTIEGLLRTGPTNTNVCDLQILMVV